MKTIDIVVTPDGKIEIDAKGFTDSTCLKALEEMQAMFGPAEEVRLKPEARHKVSVKTVIKS